MGITASLLRVPADDLAALMADVDRLDLFVAQYDYRGEPTGYLDKSIDELQELLSAAQAGVWLAPLEMPGEPLVLPGVAYFGLNVALVAQIHTKLAAIPFDSLTAHADERQLPDDLDYLRHHYENMRAFFDDAASRGLAALLRSS